MPRKCGVPGCKSNYEKTIINIGSVSTFSFPQKPSIRKAWLKAIGRPEWNPSIYAGVCRLHFADSCFENLKPTLKTAKRKQKYRLKGNSIPSINLPSEPVVEKRRHSTKSLKKNIEKTISTRSSISRETNVCCILSCNNECKQFYLFPTDPKRAKEWIKIINKKREENLIQTKNKLICRIHFEKKYLTKKSSLTFDAIPTLHLTEEEEEDDDIEGEESQSEMSDFNDVIESFNSSYPSCDDSFMMEANVEICETGENLNLDNENQEILISSQDEEDESSSNDEYQTVFTLQEKIQILNAFNSLQNTKDVATKFNTHFKIISEIVDNSYEITNNYRELPLNMQKVKIEYQFENPESEGNKTNVQTKADLKLEDKVLIVEAFKETRSMKQISKKSGLPYSQIKEVLQDGESIIMEYNRLPLSQRKRPTINLVLTKMDPSKEKHFHNLTLAEKIEILKDYNSFESIKAVCSKYHISESTMQNIIKLKDELQYLHYKMPNEFHYRTRMPTSDFKIAIDTTVLEWIKRCVKRGIVVNDDLIKHTGNEIRYMVPYSEFRASNRWIERFKKKYHVTNMIIEKPEKVSAKLNVHGTSLVLKDIIYDLYKNTSDCITDRVFKSICEHNKWKAENITNKSNLDQIMESDSTHYQGSIEEPEYCYNDDRVLETYREAVLYLKPLKSFTNAKQSTAGIGILKQIENILQEALSCDSFK